MISDILSDSTPGVARNPLHEITNKRGKEVSAENFQFEMRKESNKTETRKIHIFLLVNVRSFGRYLLYVSICVLVFSFQSDLEDIFETGGNLKESGSFSVHVKT
jgi:hypothetical protein